MQALIVVDVQQDFMPGGNLAVEKGDEVIPIINKLLNKFDLVIFTKDWHPNDMEAFASTHLNKKPLDTYINLNGDEDVLWPDHCIQDTPGAMLHQDIKFENIKKDFYIIKKGLNKNYHPYSGFDTTELNDFLKSKDVDTVFICGLATDYCCKTTALDGVKYGYNTYFIFDATRGISNNLDKTKKELEENNVIIINSKDII